MNAVKISIYRTPPTTLDLPKDQIYLWVADLRCVSMDDAVSLLDTDEIQRLKQLRTEELQHDFMARRIILRQLLGAYLKISPATIQYHRSLHNKLMLKTIDDDIQPIYFNLAHSHGQALFAFTHIGSIGVDIEAVKAMDDMDAVASNFLSSQEQAIYLRLQHQSRIQAFYRSWTRKEAVVKAIGVGLNFPLSQLSLGSPARTIRKAHTVSIPSNVEIRYADVAIRNNYAAAYAVQLNNS